MPTQERRNKVAIVFFFFFADCKIGTVCTRTALTPQLVQASQPTNTAHIDALGECHQRSPPLATNREQKKKICHEFTLSKNEQRHCHVKPRCLQVVEAPVHCAKEQRQHGKISCEVVETEPHVAAPQNTTVGLAAMGREAWCGERTF